LRNATGKTKKVSRLRKLALGGLLALVAGVVILDLVKQPADATYAIVRQPTALEKWAPSSLPASDCSGVPKRWMVFGWDGASWDIILPLIERGELPHLASLIANGTSGNLYGFQPSLSPVLWTTVATGVSPDRHGIVDFVKRKHRLARRLERILHLGKIKIELYSNADRKVRALWNLLTDHGKSSLVIGYHNTYPAESVRGAFVSNYLVQAYFKTLMRANEPLSAGLAHSLASPAGLTDDVLRIEQQAQRRLASEISRFANFDDATLARFVEQSRSLDAEYPSELPELMLLHFQGVDLASHYFLYFHDPEAFATMDWSAETRQALDREMPQYRETLVAFYRYLDEWLGRFLAMRDETTAVMVLSDHGFEPESDAARGGHHRSALPGSLAIEGPGIRHGARLDDATLYDILPTLLAALELPIAEDLDGRPLEAAFCSETWDNLSHAAVATYNAEETFAPKIAPPPELADQVEEQLRSLGYIQ